MSVSPHSPMADRRLNVTGFLPPKKAEPESVPEAETASTERAQPEQVASEEVATPEPEVAPGPEKPASVDGEKVSLGTKADNDDVDDHGTGTAADARAAGPEVEVATVPAPGEAAGHDAVDKEVTAAMDAEADTGALEPAAKPEGPQPTKAAKPAKPEKPEKGKGEGPKKVADDTKEVSGGVERGSPSSVAMAVEMRGIEDLRPNKINNKIFSTSLSEQGLADLAENIAECGIRQPIEVRRDGLILDGERRWRAARTAGSKEVPVKVADDVSDEDLPAYLLARMLTMRDLTVEEKVNAFLLVRKDLKQRYGNPANRPKKAERIRSPFWSGERIKGEAARRARLGSGTTAIDAVYVFKHGDEDLKGRVNAGTTSINAAREELRPAGRQAKNKTEKKKKKKDVKGARERWVAKDDAIASLQDLSPKLQKVFKRAAAEDPKGALLWVESELEKLRGIVEPSIDTAVEE